MFGVGISSDPWKLTSLHPCAENKMSCRAIVWDLIANRSAGGEFRPRQTRQLPRAVDLKGRLLSCQIY